MRLRWHIKGYTGWCTHLPYSSHHNTNNHGGLMTGHDLGCVVRGALAMDPKERLSAQQIVEKLKQLEEASTTGLDRRGF